MFQPENLFILRDLFLRILFHHQPHLIQRVKSRHSTKYNLSIIVDVGDVHRPVVVEDVEDDVVRRVKEVTNVNGGPTVQEHHMFDPL